MEKISVEVMNMKNRDTSFLQKLKDNAFYVALGLGLMAILAVVAVYTVEQNGSRLASNEVDLNKASDYKTITEQKVEKTNGDTAKKEEVQTDTQQTATRQQTTSESTQESIELTEKDPQTMLGAVPDFRRMEQMHYRSHRMPENWILQAIRQ